MSGERIRNTTIVDASASQNLLTQEGVSLAINGFLMAQKAARDGDAQAQKDCQRHLGLLHGRYWRVVSSILSGILSRRRAVLEFQDDERLLVDLGLFDARMLDGDRNENRQSLLDELNDKGAPGCYYLSEWLANRNQQLQLEHSLAGTDSPEDNYASQLVEARRRVLSRLSDYLTGLPGVPLEVSESMRSGELDNTILGSGINALRDPRRKNLILRRNLWMLREQILAKARARVNGPGAMRLFDMLNEIYARDWRERYDRFLNEADTSMEETGRATDVRSGDHASKTVDNAGADMLMREVRQIRMRTFLMAAVDGKDGPDPVLEGAAPRVTKKDLADFLPIPRMFDRDMAEMPPLIIVPGAGRGFFAWESGCLMVSLRPLVGADDSVATALAWLRMLDDRYNRGGTLRAAFEKRFPGAVFRNDFPADYRAWLCRLSKGDAGAMSPERRAFFRDYIGPDVSGPILPHNLRNIGPQTMAAICRRLEKQIAGGDSDVNLNRRLAALYWQQGNFEAAGLQFNAAMRLAPDDAETLFAAGMFMRSREEAEAANDCFRLGAEHARENLWGIYCEDALDNLV